MSLSSNPGMGSADIAAVMHNGCGNYGGGFGGGWGNGGIMDILVLFLLFGLLGGNGFGRGGFGGNGCGANTTCATPADVYSAVDQQTLISKLDQQTYGLADSTFALNNTMTNGFAQAELSRCNMQAAFMSQLNAMAAESAKCCCETQRLLERGFADTNYNLATQSCDTRNAISNAARDITDNQNCNTRAILDALTAQRIADKDEKIAAQNQRIFSLELAASQATQNNYLVNQIRPCPVPAYITCNPYAASYGFGYGSGYSNFGGCNSGCGGCCA